MRVLVTGGSGFIGTNIVEHYRVAGAEVVNFDLKPPMNRAHAEHWVRGDLRDAAAVSGAFRASRPDLVVHLGARTDLLGHDVQEYAANTSGVQHVIDAVRGTRSIERVLFASSRMVCATDYTPRDEEDYSPPNPYGESKVVGEKLVRAAGLSVSWAIFRPTSIWGPWFGVPYKDFFLQVAAGRFVRVRGYDVRKSFGYVGNSVYQLERLATCPADLIDGRTFYLGDYPPVRVNDMAERIRAEIGAPKIRTVPRGALLVVATAGDVLKKLGWKEPPLTRFRLSNLLTEMVIDLSALHAIAGDLPFDMPTGVHATVAWLKGRGEV